MGSTRPGPSRWLTGHFDLTLTALLAILVLALNLPRHTWGAAALDLTACVAAALTTRWPRAAGTALAIIVGSLLFLPPEWPSMGEYALLIPILGTGIRGQRRERGWMTVVYGLILAALSYDIARGWSTWPLAVAVWAVLVAAMWGIGNLFTAYRTATEQVHRAELQQHRFAVARDLHDTVSRELARASLQAQAARQIHPSAELDAVVREVQQASTQLRRMLSLLREDSSDGRTNQPGESASDALRAGMKSLGAQGLTVSVTVDGDLDDIPPALTPTVRAVIGEACANIERHAHPGHPCTIVISVGDNVFDAVFINTSRRGVEPPTSLGVGLTGLGERLALVEGELAVEQEGSQWLSRMTIPL